MWSTSSFYRLRGLISLTSMLISETELLLHPDPFEKVLLKEDAIYRMEPKKDLMTIPCSKKKNCKLKYEVMVILICRLYQREIIS